MVRYWAMQAVHGEFRPNDEVDEVRWTPLGQLGELLTYPHDLGVVSGLGLLYATSPERHRTQFCDRSSLLHYAR
jgi:hypothetical protein